MGQLRTWEQITPAGIADVYSVAVLKSQINYFWSWRHYPHINVYCKRRARTFIQNLSQRSRVKRSKVTWPLCHAATFICSFDLVEFCLQLGNINTNTGNCWWAWVAASSCRPSSADWTLGGRWSRRITTAQRTPDVKTAWSNSSGRGSCYVFHSIRLRLRRSADFAACVQWRRGENSRWLRLTELANMTAFRWWADVTIFR